ncbi:NAD-dependent epimerase/dehydratase family protein [Arthrobacter sp. H5]|uniref:NAD-dependent epimerase/dehydratase family protein n=1 Tax=Arthrobacter sp. H5 TaxID=1267973 RepID=UPI00047FEAED|nr:NAD-dependent epimerase/dehydratase family protein [Arthrobacter sp. H5]
MRIAVIGATGNVGTALLRRLRLAAQEDPSISIVGIARRLPSTDQEPYSGVEWHSADVGTDRGRTNLTTALEGADAVVHLAWAIQPNRDEAAMHRTNVIGTQNALRAAADAGVRHFVCASSVAAYSPAPKDETVDETWPTSGIASSHYSRFKAAQEELLDEFETNYPEIPVARLRPGLSFNTEAGSEIGRYFLGPLVPKGLVKRLGLLQVLPIPAQLVFQAVHVDDVAQAYWLAVSHRASGAFNIAANPVLTPELVAGILGARRVLNIPVPLLRSLVAASWTLRLQTTDPGWIDMAAQAPVMNTDHARAVLGWKPEYTSIDAIRQVLDGIDSGSGLKGSPLLHPSK